MKKHFISLPQRENSLRQPLFPIGTEGFLLRESYHLRWRWPAVIPDRHRGFPFTGVLSPPLEVASIAFVWSAAKPLSCQTLWAGKAPHPNSRQKPGPT